jgi:hypothetical protein
VSREDARSRGEARFAWKGRVENGSDAEWGRLLWLDRGVASRSCKNPMSKGVRVRGFVRFSGGACGQPDSEREGLGTPKAASTLSVAGFEKNHRKATVVWRLKMRRRKAKGRDGALRN